jgi:hypothetical protein
MRARVDGQAMTTKATTTTTMEGTTSPHKTSLLLHLSNHKVNKNGE